VLAQHNIKWDCLTWPYPVSSVRLKTT
jgi:hypothetical protein